MRMSVNASQTRLQAHIDGVLTILASLNEDNKRIFTNPLDSGTLFQPHDQTPPTKKLHELKRFSEK